MRDRRCELCRGRAALYCPSDSAFLCWTCDAAVHGANFLVARHLRRPLCPKCGDLAGDSVSGAAFRPFRLSWCSCSPEEEERLSSSSASSACMSTAESLAAAPPRKIRFEGGRRADVSGGEASSAVESSNAPARARLRRRRKNASPTGSPELTPELEAEGILASWSKKLGLNRRTIVRLASKALVGLSPRGLAEVPFRVRAAASFWLGLRLCGDRSLATWHNLRRVAVISGVPAKVILAAESRLSRELRRRLRLRPNTPPRDMEEGWAECSA